jgi:hypothetical protein
VLAASVRGVEGRYRTGDPGLDEMQTGREIFSNVMMELIQSSKISQSIRENLEDSTIGRNVIGSWCGTSLEPAVKGDNIIKL